MAYARTPGDDVKSGVRSLGDTAYEAAEKFANKAGEKVGEAFQTAEETAEAAAQGGREAVQNVQQVAGNVRGAVDKSLREQPMATLAVAAALGFVVGALWKT